MLRKFRRCVAAALSVFLVSGTCIAVNLTSGSSSFAISSNTYRDRFLCQYEMIHNISNGYFSPDGVPYHSIETLVVDAPDYGHETTSEAYSYYVWLEAVYGKFMGDWTGFARAWDTIDKYMVPNKENQPGMAQYNPDIITSFVPEGKLPCDYPFQSDKSVNTGSDPINASLKLAYGTDEMYGMHWIQDVDNWYGYGNQGDGVSKNSFINSFSRGEQESVWESIPHPSWEAFKWGGPYGFLDLYFIDSAYSKQWSYKSAPDADARAIQATYWASQWGGAAVSKQVSKASKMGDYLRYSFFDKYFKPIGTASLNGSGGTGYDSAHYLISQNYSWGGGIDESWAWKTGNSFVNQSYQNPMTAYALSSDSAMKPRSSSGANDWNTSLSRQLEFLAWLQSAEGAIAGGANNSWNGKYDQIPSTVNKFYGMGYDEDPVQHDPPSNYWFGAQTRSMQRVAEYYYVSGDAKARSILDKWVKWVLPNVTFSLNHTEFKIPIDLRWTGQPDNWSGSATANNNLHVDVLYYGQDLGVGASLSNTLLYYAAAAKKHGGNIDQGCQALETAQELLDIMWDNYRDEKGIAMPEDRYDYRRFFQQEIYIPEGWTGKNAQGADIKNGMKFIDMRPKYKDDPSWPALNEAYDSGTHFTVTYHRFWAQCEIAIAFGVMDILFPGQQPPIIHYATPTPYTSVGTEIQRSDLNGDGVINMADVMLVAGAFNVNSTNPRYNQKYDINNDSAINFGDVMIIAKYFNKLVKNGSM